MKTARNPKNRDLTSSPDSYGLGYVSSDLMVDPKTDTLVRLAGSLEFSGVPRNLDGGTHCELVFTYAPRIYMQVFGMVLIRRLIALLRRICSLLKRLVGQALKWLVVPLKLKLATDWYGTMLSLQLTLLGILIGLFFWLVEPPGRAGGRDVEVPPGRDILGVELVAMGVDMIRSTDAEETYEGTTHVRIVFSGSPMFVGGMIEDEDIGVRIVRLQPDPILSLYDLSMPQVSIENISVDVTHIATASDCSLRLDLVARIPSELESLMVRHLPTGRAMIGEVDLKIDFDLDDAPIASNVSIPVFFHKPADRVSPHITRVIPEVICAEQAVELSFEASDDRADAQEMLYRVDVLNDDEPATEWLEQPIRLDRQVVCQGEYRCMARVKDPAGNETSPDDAFPFQLVLACPDNEAPVVAFDANITLGRGGGDVELLIDADDNCTPAEDLDYDLTVGKRTLHGLSDVSYFWLSNGEHEMRMTVTDVAGHTSDPFTETVFVDGLRAGMRWGGAASVTRDGNLCLGAYGGFHVDATTNLNAALDIDILVPTGGEFLCLLPELAVSAVLGRGDFRAEIGAGAGAYFLPIDNWSCRTYGARLRLELPLGSGHLQLAIRIAGATYDFGERNWFFFPVFRVGWKG